MSKNRFAPRAPAMNDMDRGARTLGAHWAPVVALLGKAVDPSTADGHLNLNWQARSLAMDAEARQRVRDAAVESIRACCGNHQAHPDPSLRSVLIQRSISRSLATLSRLGMFSEALGSLEEAATETSSVCMDTCLAVLTRHACEAPWHKDPLSQEQRLERLANSCAWHVPRVESEEHGVFRHYFDSQDIDRAWARSLPMVFKAAQKPKSSPACAALIGVWSEMYWPKIEQPLHFIHEHGEELGRQKIKDGVVDAACWAQTPFGMKIGLAFSLDSSSKMGAWATDAVLREAAALPQDADGQERRSLVSAAMWLSMDRKKIDALEACLGAASCGEFLALGARSLAASEDASMWRVLADEKLQKAGGAWALQAVKKAGLPDPKDALGFGSDPEPWLATVELLKASRLAKDLKKEAPAPRKAKSAALRM